MSAPRCICHGCAQPAVWATLDGGPGGLCDTHRWHQHCRDVAPHVPLKDRLTSLLARSAQR